MNGAPRELSFLSMRMYVNLRAGLYYCHASLCWLSSSSVTDTDRQAITAVGGTLESRSLLLPPLKHLILVIRPAPSPSSRGTWGTRPCCPDFFPRSTARGNTRVPSPVCWTITTASHSVHPPVSRQREFPESDFPSMQNAPSGPSLLALLRCALLVACNNHPDGLQMTGTANIIINIALSIRTTPIS